MSIFRVWQMHIQCNIRSFKITINWVYPRDSLSIRGKDYFALFPEVWILSYSSSIGSKIFYFLHRLLWHLSLKSNECITWSLFPESIWSTELTVDTLPAVEELLKYYIVGRSLFTVWRLLGCYHEKFYFIFLSFSLSPSLFFSWQGRQTKRERRLREW